MRLRNGLVLTVIALGFAVAFAGAAAGSPPQDRTSLLITQMANQVRSVSSPQLRDAYAQSLATVIVYLSDEGKIQDIDDATIDHLAALLQDDSDAGDFWVAEALGLLGPKAARAIPILEAAHPKACAKLRAYFFSTGVHSVDAIELALERITGSSPRCR